MQVPVTATVTATRCKVWNNLSNFFSEYGHTRPGRVEMSPSSAQAARITLAASPVTGGCGPVLMSKYFLSLPICAHRRVVIHASSFYVCTAPSSSWSFVPTRVDLNVTQAKSRRQ